MIRFRGNGTCEIFAEPIFAPWDIADMRNAANMLSELNWKFQFDGQDRFIPALTLDDIVSRILSIG